MRERTIHRCRACGASTPRWAGRCPTCTAWNTLEEAPLDRSGRPHEAAQSIALSDVDRTAGHPLPTGVVALDRAVGGGLVPGSVTLIGGEPGIGKSTLLLQVAALSARAARTCLLVSAEESASQVARRAERVGAAISGVRLVETRSCEAALDAARADKPDLLIVDSIQAIAASALGSVGGSATQVRECAAQLITLAKAESIAVVLVGHVTKDGSLAGPRVLEHLVDTVCSFEGDRHHAMRVLSVVKHRFGPTGELGVFMMNDGGLESVEDPSALLLEDRRSDVSGSVVVPILEGRRPLLVEIQALVARSPLPTPRRTAQGIVPGRLSLILAVLEQRAGCAFGGLDVFASVVGGVRITEPSADLGLGLALASAYRDVPIGPDVVACGEIGLGGELRQVAHADRRLIEAARRGFTRAIVPLCSPDAPTGMTLQRVGTVVEAMGVLGG